MCSLSLVILRLVLILCGGGGGIAQRERFVFIGRSFNESDSVRKNRNSILLLHKFACLGNGKIRRDHGEGCLSRHLCRRNTDLGTKHGLVTHAQERSHISGK